MKIGGAASERPQRGVRGDSEGLRNTKGAPKEHQRRTKGTPKEQLRAYRGSSKGVARG